MSNVLIEALRKRYEGEIAAAVANIHVYVSNPIGIGDHPDLVGAMDAQVAVLCNAQDKLNALDEHFPRDTF